MMHSLTVVAKVFSNTLIFCCKNVSSFWNAKATCMFFFFSAKISVYLPLFQENLTLH